MKKSRKGGDLRVAIVEFTWWDLVDSIYMKVETRVGGSIHLQTETGLQGSTNARISSPVIDRIRWVVWGAVNEIIEDETMEGLPWSAQ